MDSVVSSEDDSVNKLQKSKSEKKKAKKRKQAEELLSDIQDNHNIESFFSKIPNENIAVTSTPLDPVKNKSKKRKQAKHATHLQDNIQKLDDLLNVQSGYNVRFADIEQADAIHDDDVSMYNLSHADLMVFFQKVKEKLRPQDKKFKHTVSVKRFPWDEIEFNNFTASQCEALWAQLQGTVRKYRTFQELLEDAEAFVASGKLMQKFRPKKPSTAYMCFFKEEFEKLKKENPKISCIEAGKILGKRYRDLPPEKKEKYGEQFNSLKKEYKVKLSDFEENHPEVKALKRRTDRLGRAVAETAKIEQPRTAFEIFYDKRRVSFPKEDPKILHAQLKNEYNTLSNIVKAYYIGLAKREYLDKLVDFEDFTTTKTGIKVLKIKNNVTKDEEKLYFSAAGLPTKPPATGYVLFSQEYATAELKDLPPTTRMKLAGERWKQLIHEEKEAYNLRAQKLNEEYISAQKAFISNLSPVEAQMYMLHKVLPFPAIDEFPRDSRNDTECDTTVDNDEFPRSALVFFKRKTGLKKSDWKQLNDSEKEKWRRKFEKKKKKHVAENSDVVN